MKIWELLERPKAPIHFMNFISWLLFTAGLLFLTLLVLCLADAPIYYDIFFSYIWRYAYISRLDPIWSVIYIVIAFIFFIFSYLTHVVAKHLSQERMFNLKDVMPDKPPEPEKA